MRPYNFGAGPAMLPESILLEAQAELLNWQGMGRSVMEIGHRTPEFMALMAQAKADLRALLAIPDNYQILFLGGAARTQFGMIPMNMLANGQQAGHLVSGVWSAMAFEEAVKLKKAYCVASSESVQFHDIPHQSAYQLQDNTTYLYYTPNETVNGTYYSYCPLVEGIPLVADMTSCLLSEPIDVSNYALIFAGAQKNISIAGLTIVIIRSDLLDNSAMQPIPCMFDYQFQAMHDSLYATLPVFNCYLALKMFEWIKAQGGVEALYRINQEKASRLYDYIDSSSAYHCDVVKPARSLMNVCFSLHNTALEPVFLAEAARHKLLALNGHKLVGGLRASLYNAMPLSGVEALIAFMSAFADDHGL